MDEHEGPVGGWERPGQCVGPGDAIRTRVAACEIGIGYNCNQRGPAYKVVVEVQAGVLAAERVGSVCFGTHERLDLLQRHDVLERRAFVARLSNAVARRCLSMAGRGGVELSVRHGR